MSLDSWISSSKELRDQVARLGMERIRDAFGRLRQLENDHGGRPTPKKLIDAIQSLKELDESYTEFAVVHRTTDSLIKFISSLKFTPTY